jgi:hypothetical protein
MTGSIGVAARHDIRIRLATATALAGERVRDQAIGMREWARHLRASSNAG